MSDHDPLCPAGIGVDYVISSFPIPCNCDVIRKARADEREKIAKAIEAMDAAHHADWDWKPVVLAKDAARLARQGGSGE